MKLNTVIRSPKQNSVMAQPLSPVLLLVRAAALCGFSARDTALLAWFQ